MPSFDTVLKADSVELRNAVEQSNKEISGRFDFKGSDARVEQKEFELTAFADSECPDASGSPDSHTHRKCRLFPSRPGGRAHPGRGLAYSHRGRPNGRNPV